VVLVATFFLVQLGPGDPVRAALGPTAPPETVEALRIQLGLDRPIGEQFARYLSGLVTGDLGVSVTLQRPVAAILAERLPTTLMLAVASFLVAAIGAFPIGVATAVSAYGGRRRPLDLAVSGLLGVLVAVPNFLLAVLLIAVFSVGLGALPPAGWSGPSNAVLPVVALAIGPLAYLARIVHVEMLRALAAPYLTTARSKRLPARLLYARHALPNIVTASRTAGGVVLTGLVAGTVLVETVFVIPGISCQGISVRPMYTPRLLATANLWTPQVWAASSALSRPVASVRKKRTGSSSGMVPARWTMSLMSWRPARARRRPGR
jgi:peptide/nickel transport system permease protein